MTTQSLAIAGMTCAQCVSAVTDELSKLPGVREVKVVALVAGGVSTVHLDSDRHLGEEQLRQAVDEAGYDVVDDTS
jgi:copper chaperone